MTSFCEPLIFAVGGAKGGVGKSMVCANLAIQYAQQGLKVALLDLDFGAANLHTLFGLSKPQYGWSEYFEDPNQSLEYYLSETKQKNLFLLPASGFVPEMADLNYDDKVRLIAQMKRLNVDAIFLDLGAGSSKDMLDFFAIADYKVLVSTSEPTALMNNFEFIKNLIYRSFKRLLKQDDRLSGALNEFKRKSNATVEHLRAEAEKIEPWMAEGIDEVTTKMNLFMVFNQIRKIEEAKAALRFKKVCYKQLSLAIEYPGFIFYNEAVAASVQKMLPISLVLPESITSRIFKRMAHALIHQTQSQKNKKNLLDLAWSHLDQDYKKNRAEEKRHQLARN